MKFITEDELRYLYRKEPFTTYEPEPGTRLTPGARQFLLDRGIDLYDEPRANPIIRESLTQEICCPSANPNHNGGGEKGGAGCFTARTSAAGSTAGAAGAGSPKRRKSATGEQRWCGPSFCSVEAVFLRCEQTLLETDILMAQNLTRLSKQFSDIRHMVEGKGMAQNLPCRECHGVTCENFSDDLEDCFEITDFHVQLEKGREILALLRIALRAAGD